MHDVLRIAMHVQHERPPVQVSTIHAFCWDLIKGFQPYLRAKVSEIDAWAERLEEADGVGTQRIDYDLGHRSINDTHLLLHHDDVITLAVALMEQRKFRNILSARFPIIFIDEYQDTNVGFANSILQHILAPRVGPLIGPGVTS